MDLSTLNAPHYLFSNGDLREFLEAQLNALAEEIEGLAPDAILTMNIGEFVTYATTKYQLATPSLRETEITVDQHETKVDISGDPTRLAHILHANTPTYITGTRITYYIPFDGDATLFSRRTTTFNYNPPEGQVSGTHLFIMYKDTKHEDQAIKAQFTQDLAAIKQWLTWVNNDVSLYNQALPGHARTRFTERRVKLTKDQQLVTSLGYPLRRRPNAPNTYTVPIVKKKIPLPPPARPSAEPSPITDAIYEDILQIIQSMVLVMERSPDAFKNMKEEDLRTHFLVQLNGQYQGEGTAETFNTSGKTDILIRHQNKNLFIAECKFWNGPNSLTGAIDQLLGYTQWRDTKTALLLFSRNRNFTDVLKQIPGTATAHPNFVRQQPYQNETGYRCTMRQKDDPQRHLTLTILAFNIPT